MNDRLVFQKYCFNSFVSCYPKLSRYIATSFFNINGNPIQFLLTCTDQLLLHMPRPLSDINYFLNKQH